MCIGREVSRRVEQNREMSYNITALLNYLGTSTSYDEGKSYEPANEFLT
jgi:hypothetical protein